MNANSFMALEQWIKEAFFFREYVPPMWLGVVFRGSEFSRFLYPGKSNRMAKIGRECVIGYINLETSYLPFEVSNLLTKDGHSFQAAGTLSYVYNPSKCKQIEDCHIEYILKSCTSQKAVQSYILTTLSYQLHNVVGNNTAIELMSGVKSAQISRALDRNLRRELRDFGVQISSNSGVLVSKLTPPVMLQEAHQKGLTHFLEVVSGLNQLTQDEMDQLLQVKLYENGNTNFFLGFNKKEPAFSRLGPRAPFNMRAKHN